MPKKQTMQKKNCWEYMKCGRQPGGDKVSELCECPTAILSTYPDGKYNSGKALGRRCWRISGTLCGEGVQVQGTFATKISDCRECTFYKKVKEEEGEDFKE